jgi:uncharacterized protein
MKISRRQFVEASAVGCAAALLPRASFSATEKIPRRDYGRTGEKVSILAFGGGNRYSMYQSDEEALAVLNHAIDLGINYIDTAHEYGQDGQSEIRIGKVLKTRRKEVILATKFYGRKADEAMSMIETSLERMQVDHVDVLSIHGLSSPEELAAIEAPDGALKSLYKARDQKMTRFIGVTCHTDPKNLANALERHDFDVVQMALNAGALGMQFDPEPAKAVPMPEGSFEAVALPVALRKKMAINAMKIFGQDFLQNKAPAEKLVHYSLSLPVCTAVIGMPKPEYLEQNVAFARNFKPLPVEEMRRITQSIGEEHKAAMEQFLQNHIDV